MTLSTRVRGWESRAWPLYTLLTWDKFSRVLPNSMPLDVHPLQYALQGHSEEHGLDARQWVHRVIEWLHLGLHRHRCGQ